MAGTQNSGTQNSDTQNAVTQGRAKESCEYEGLEACLQRNNRDLTRCEKELEEFKEACKARQEQARRDAEAVNQQRQTNTEKESN